MRDGWEIARERRRKTWKEPRVYVSLNRRGEIAMNAEAFRRIGRPANVTLLYDARARHVGVKFPVSADGNFFRVREYGRGRRMRIVRAWRLLKQFGIEVERTLVFVNPAIENLKGSPMLVLDLARAETLRVEGV